MATGSVLDQGKGKFLRSFLGTNRDANLEAANTAWAAEGHDDSLSERLFGKIRSELGLTRRGKKKGESPEADPSSVAKAQAKPGSKPSKTSSKAGKVSTPPRKQSAEKEPSKSAFVEEMLGRQPQANMKAINQAWASAGHEGTISPSIFFKVKRVKGQTGGTEVLEAPDGTPESGSSTKNGNVSPTATVSEPEPKAAKPRKAATPHSNGEHAPSRTTPAKANQGDDHGRELHQIEGEIDELMFRLKSLGSFTEVQEALRAARRLLVRSHQH